MDEAQQRPGMINLHKAIYVDNGPGPAQSGLQKGAAA